MQDTLLFIKEYSKKLTPILPLAAFAVAFLMSYFLQPASFELLWKGRTFQLFFVWLIALELILGWENLQASKLSKSVSVRSFLFVVALLLPTIFVAVSFYAGVNTFIADSARQNGVYWWNDLPIAFEYLVFAGLFCTMLYISSGTKGLKNFSVPILFSAVVGAIFVIDSVFPYEQFTPFQFFVPATTVLAANTLNAMGYHTTLSMTQGFLPQLTAVDPSNPLKPVTFAIAWPCAGVESLLIFTVTILLFLKRMPISWRAKVGYFAVGAGVTYFINILRIVSIFQVALSGGDVDFFHSTYGPLYPFAWIVSYPLVILGSQSLWHRIRNRNKTEKMPQISENDSGKLESGAG